MKFEIISKPEKRIEKELLFRGSLEDNFVRPELTPDEIEEINNKKDLKFERELRKLDKLIESIEKNPNISKEEKLDAIDYQILITLRDITDEEAEQKIKFYELKFANQLK